MPGLRLFHLCADEQREKSRQTAHEKQRPPAPVGIDNAIGSSSEKEAECVSLLQQSRKKSAPSRRHRFHGERCSDSPFASHADAVEQAQNEKNFVVGSEAGKNYKERVIENVEDQRNAPAIAVREQAENERSHPARGQARGDRQGNRRDVGAEYLRNRSENKGQDEEIEGVQRPAQKAGQDGVGGSGTARRSSFRHRGEAGAKRAGAVLGVVGMTVIARSARERRGPGGRPPQVCRP